MLPTVKVVSTGIKVAGVSTSIPNTVLGNNEGSRSIIMRGIQLPHRVQVLPDLRRELTLPLLTNLREVLRDPVDRTSGPVRGLETLTFGGGDEDGIKDDEVSDDLPGLLQLVRDHESDEATHGVTGNDVWSVRLHSPDERDIAVRHLLDRSETVDRTKVLVTNGPHFVRHVGTKTHEGSGHTGDIVNEEHARMDTLLLDGKELDQEVVFRVFSSHDLPLVLAHSVNDDVAQLADRWPIKIVSQKQLEMVTTKRT